MTNLTKMLMLISTLVLVIGGGFSFYFTYQGYQPVTLTNENKAGIALDGFDVVAYHTIGAAQKGEQKFQVSWSDSIWYFTSLENRQAFSEKPEKYAPQYGGYDPYGMAINGTAQAATPELWTREEGKLYLFYSGDTRKFWRVGQLENMEKAASQWARLKQQLKYKTDMELE